jgi:hypothetical protein
MCRFISTVTLILLAAGWSGAVQAQSSLGITGMDLSFGHLLGNAGGARANARLDVALTAVHGVQLDLGLSDTGDRIMGSTVAHLYMTPRAGQKYGLFVALHDQDAASFTFASLGLMGRMALSDRVTIEGHGGIGYALGGELDAIFAGAAARWQATDGLALTVGLDLAEFDEATLSAIGYTARLNAEFHVSDRIELITGFETTGRTGRDARGGDPAVFLGMTMRFGGAADPLRRTFHSPDPLRPLWDLDLR